jgi:NTE family protein
MVKFVLSSMKFKLIFLTCLLAFGAQISAQKVGVVLSGGGASAMAHVGFLRALEENNIPIDYITGTSMGAIVGAMYCAGYSVDQIDSIVNSPEYLLMATGVIDDQYSYYFTEDEPDPGIVTIKYGGGSIISTTLPTNLIDPVLLDYKLMEGLSQASAAANYNFDSLYIPFRCMASDIENKEQVMFDRGHLSVAVRASSTYPFYLQPIRVDGMLLYDGGLYNNFPSDVMYEEFLPDIILGCNVSGNVAPPKEDDLLSQLENMIRAKSNFDLLCEAMIIVEPNSKVGTFDFDRIHVAVNDGYTSTMARMPEILDVIDHKVTLQERTNKRRQFLKKYNPFVFDDIEINGLDRSQKRYVKNLFGKESDTISISQIKPNYFRVFADDKIRSIYPIAQYKANTDHFTLMLDVKKEKDLFLTFGGNFSSRPINTGYVALRYNILKSMSTTLFANSYFGKYYGSVHSHLEFDFVGNVPFSIEPGFTFNRWDYFRNFATFFEEVRPSFVVLNEKYGGVKVKFPAGNKGRLSLDMNYGQLDDDYYQTENFLALDTADKTTFNMGVVNAAYERNTLNRKQWANTGTFLKLNAKFVTGEETSFPGSTTALKDTTVQNHSWVVGRLEYRNYFAKMGPITLGFHLEGLASTQTFFQNYIASVIASPSFQPIPESHTYFIQQHRAHNYAAAGMIGVLNFHRNLELRGEVYAFNAFGKITNDDNNRAVYDFTPEQLFIASTSLIFQSPLGPLTFSVNYYDKKAIPWSVVFNFGYLLYNKSIRD